MQNQGSKSAFSFRRDSGDFSKRFLSKAPWWIISGSLTLVILGLASLARLQRGEEEERAPRGSDDLFVVRKNFEKIDPSFEKELEIKSEPIPLKPPDSQDLFEEALPSIFHPLAKMSDHLESADGEEFGEKKGQSLDSDLFEENLYNSIGLGSGSRRGPVGPGFGSDGGGIRNLTTPGTRRPTSDATEDTEKAVREGLEWLARHQSPDGSWRPEGFSSLCEKSPCEGMGQEVYTVGCTGLSLLAFLGAGYHQFSTESWVDSVTNRLMITGHIVRDGLRYLKEQQNEDGALGPVVREFFYNHSIGTLALSEAYALSRNGMVKERAQDALDFLMRYQTPAPGGSGFLGWRYVPGSGESDTSVTGWAVMALKSAESSDLEIAQSSYDGALTFVRAVTAPDFRVGYRGREDVGQQVMALGRNGNFQNHPALTAVGMLIRAFVEHDLKDPALKGGAEILVKDRPVWEKDPKSIDFYYWYYASLALNQFDGPASPRGEGRFWRAWKKDLEGALLPSQRKEGCQAGSWDPDSRWGFAGGRIYATAINTLTLEVYYRLPNAFGG